MLGCFLYDKTTTQPSFVTDPTEDLESRSVRRSFKEVCVPRSSQNPVDQLGCIPYLTISHRTSRLYLGSQIRTLTDPNPEG